MKIHLTPRSDCRAGTTTILLLVGWLAASPVFAQDKQGATNACGSLENAYGPYDYRTERTGRLHVVDKFHFTPEVEALIKGSSSYLGDDLSYTLRASPNHHRALMAIVRYGERTKSPQPPHLQYSIDCYFDRAIRFRPDDTVVREIYAQYLGNQGRIKEALQQLNAAEEFAKDNPLSHLNIGLVYFELKAYDRARQQAYTAMALGLARQELVDRLKQVGQWQDPPTSGGTPDSAPVLSKSPTAPAAPASEPHDGAR